MPEIREGTVADAAAIAEIYNESVAAADATMDDRPKSAEEVQRQIEGFGEREGYLVLEVDGRVLGWTVLKAYSPKGGYRFCRETSTFLRRSEMRKGHGSRLERAAIERCRQLGIHHVIARIFADNLASIRFHERFGYELVGIQREIGYLGGRFRDVAVMQLVLADVRPGSGEPAADQSM